MSQSAIEQAAENSTPGAIELAVENSPRVDRIQKPKSIAHELLELFKSSLDRALELPEVEVQEAIETPPGVTFSDSFLTRYSPPQAENIHYRVETDGQLSLLDFEVESVDEPPDPDDFESLDAFREAMARWDTENPEPLTVSMNSMCEWAPCPEEWYWPKPEILPLKASSMLKVLEVSLMSIEQSDSADFELLPIESSSTSDFSIPTFGGFADRTNGNSSDEPPTAGVGARLPKPKPPNFPPEVVAAGDRSSIKQFARSATLLSGRAPPGGDAM